MKSGAPAMLEPNLIVEPFIAKPVVGVDVPELGCWITPP